MLANVLTGEWLLGEAMGELLKIEVCWDDESNEDELWPLSGVKGVSWTGNLLLLVISGAEEPKLIRRLSLTQAYTNFKYSTWPKQFGLPNSSGVTSKEQACLNRQLVMRALVVLV